MLLSYFEQSRRAVKISLTSIFRTTRLRRSHTRCRFAPAAMQLESMLMVARGSKGQIVGCIAVEVSVCMGEVSSEQRAGVQEMY